MDTAKKLFVAALLILVAVQGAFSWGNATHVYLARELGVKFGPLNRNEMYGAVLPDVFNTMFDANGQFLYDATHHNFMPVYRMAWRPSLKSVGLGFLTHNDTWGADFTAHHASFMFPGEGYAIAKGAALVPRLMPVLVDILHAGGLPSPDADYVAGLLAPEMGHDLSETAVDLLVRRNLDRGVGLRMMLAAQTRPAEVPHLLAAAYAEDLAAFAGIPVADASALIVGTEKEYKKLITQYGLAFSRPENQTIAILAAQTAPVAEMLIEANVPIPGFDVTVTADQVAGFLSDAVALVEPDYAQELAATMRFVERGLRDHGIRPACPIFAYNADETSVREDDPVTMPAQFSLGQNYPNPFNPSTRISFVLPADGQVTLRVYNTIGEEVATLVNEVLPAGQHQVLWNAGGLPSGVYFYRIDHAGLTATRRMTLMK